MTKASSINLPTANRDADDPGDAMQRNVRYQNAYGVILLLAAVRGQLPYTSIWCEQHDDYLCERADGLFDAVQIKTATPENGPWYINTDGFRWTIKRFVRLAAKYPDKIAAFIFVSNVRCFKTTAAKEIGRSPVALLDVISSNGNPKDTLRKAFDELCEYCECAQDELRNVLQRVQIQKGPERESFSDEIAHSHLGTCPQCRTMTAVALDDCLNTLIEVVYRASSLQVSDPSKHWCAISGADRSDPYLQAKRISVDSISRLLDELRGAPFVYTPRKKPLNLGVQKDYLTVISRKAIKGGLAPFVDLLSHRAESAERYLLELQAVDPEKFDTIFNQITSAVKCECDEARLMNAEPGKTYGPAMLRDVLQRLRLLSQSRPDLVHHREYEVLIGLAGLLTGDCQVWWSDEFNLEERQ